VDTRARMMPTESNTQNSKGIRATTVAAAVCPAVVRFSSQESTWSWRGSVRAAPSMAKTNTPMSPTIILLAPIIAIRFHRPSVLPTAGEMRSERK